MYRALTICLTALFQWTAGALGLQWATTLVTHTQFEWIRTAARERHWDSTSMTTASLFQSPTTTRKNTTSALYTACVDTSALRRPQTKFISKLADWARRDVHVNDGRPPPRRVRPTRSRVACGPRWFVHLRPCSATRGNIVKSVDWVVGGRRRLADQPVDSSRRVSFCFAYCIPQRAHSISWVARNGVTLANDDRRPLSTGVRRL